MRLNRAGFGVLGVLLVIAIMGILAFAGWRVYTASREGEASQDQQTSGAIDNAEELDATVDELNSQDIDEKLNTSELDASLE